MENEESKIHSLKKNIKRREDWLFRGKIFLYDNINT